MFMKKFFSSFLVLLFSLLPSITAQAAEQHSLQVPQASFPKAGPGACSRNRAPEEAGNTTW